MRMASYARHHVPPDIIRHAVRLYLRFTLSCRDVEELVAERGSSCPTETVRRRVPKFGPVFARNPRRVRSRASDTWHLDEAAVSIQGRRMSLWRAVEGARPHDPGRQADFGAHRLMLIGTADAESCRRTSILDLNSEGPILAVPRVQVLDFPRPGFRREKCVMLNSAVGTSIFLDKSQHLWAANRRPREADKGYFYLVESVCKHGRARQRQGPDPRGAMCAMPIGYRR